jgi:hypothetical protein
MTNDLLIAVAYRSEGSLAHFQTITIFHFVSKHLMSRQLMGVHPMGRYLISIYLMGRYLRYISHSNGPYY